jgi:dihydrodipicolinate synthase/N-acetylneuraminate lyase
MKPLIASEIKGNWATLLLPVLADDRIDYKLLADEIDYYILARVNGIYSNGSAGEFYSQSEDEFDKINTLLAEKCASSGMPFQIGAAHPCAQTALARLRRARALAPSAIQIILPDWFPPALPEIICFLERMAAEASPVPVVIYNPPHAKRKITPAEWAEIDVRVPNVVGIKVPGGDKNWYASMRPLTRRFSIFIPGHFLHIGIARGAHGAYSNVSCLSPKFAQNWYELCIKNAGAEIGERIAAFWAANIAPIITKYGLSNMAADKAAAVAGGWLPGLTTRLRWPYASLPMELAIEIGRTARRELPEAYFFPEHCKLS